MPHLLIEVARGVLERQLLSVPIEVDASGAPVDILAPPVPIQRSVFTPFGTVRVQLIIRTVSLQPSVGSAGASVALTFDQSSFEMLSLGKSVGLLGGSITASALLVARQAAASNGQPTADVGFDLSGSLVDFRLDPAAHSRLAAEIGPAQVAPLEAALEGMLTAQFQQIGFRSAGLVLALTPGVPSEDVLTVEKLPGVVWVDTQTLCLALSYAAEPTPAPFGPVPFLPNGPTAFGMRLSNDGFQRTVRNPAVRRLARDMLSERRIDAFIADAFVARGGVGAPTEADRVAGAARLNAYLATPAGLAELANETPAPVGAGVLRKRIRDVPDPFSDFDVEVPELDLWLGDGKVEGRAVARGSVNGFGFSARLGFRATPVLVPGQSTTIELHDLEIDRPDLEISLPRWLEWATSILVGVIGGTLIGSLLGFLLSAIISSLAEAFIPSNLGSKVPAPKGQALGTLPAGVSVQRLELTPQFLAFVGSWFVGIDDPRPFYPRATLVDEVDRSPVGEPSAGRASFVCLGALGVVMTAREGTGTSFVYSRQAWRSTAKIALQTAAIPLPLKRFPWMLAVGYRTKEQYPAMPDPPVILAPGAVSVTATVWHPEPPFLGRTERRTFTLNVRALGDDGFEIAVPTDAGCILLELATHVIDAVGDRWDVLHYVDVPNETVDFGPDFHDFAAQCRKAKREFRRLKVPSLLDELWNPPNILVEAIRDAIRTEQPAVAREIGRVFAPHGAQGLQVLLAPSLATSLLKGHGA